MGGGCLAAPNLNDIKQMSTHNLYTLNCSSFKHVVFLLCHTDGICAFKVKYLKAFVLEWKRLSDLFLSVL